MNRCSERGCPWPEEWDGLCAPHLQMRENPETFRQHTEYLTGAGDVRARPESFEFSEELEKDLAAAYHKAGTGRRIAGLDALERETGLSRERLRYEGRKRGFSRRRPW